MNSVRYKLLQIIDVIVDKVSLLSGPQSPITHVLDFMYPLSDNHKYTTDLYVSRFVVVFKLTKYVIHRNRPAIESVLPKWYGSSNLFL